MGHFWIYTKSIYAVPFWIRVINETTVDESRGVVCIPGCLSTILMIFVLKWSGKSI